MPNMCIKSSAIWVLGILALAFAANHANAISCGEAVVKMLPCLSYLLGRSSSVTVACCEGAQQLNQIASSKPERKAICECFKKAAVERGVNTDRARALPVLCSITAPLPINPNVDCNN